MSTCFGRPNGVEFNEIECSISWEHLYFLKKQLIFTQIQLSLYHLQSSRNFQPLKLFREFCGELHSLLFLQANDNTALRSKQQAGATPRGAKTSEGEGDRAENWQWGKTAKTAGDEVIKKH